MNYIENPNSPQKPVTLAVVDGRISTDMEQGFTRLGVRLIKTEKYKGIYEAISYHPDIMIHHTGGEQIVYAPGTPSGVLDDLKHAGFHLMAGSTWISSEYPFNIAYNAARVGRFAFHNLKYTDTVLRDELEKMGVELVHVKQGYTKCSISVVDGSSIITSDAGIARVAESRGVEALLIEPEKDILLPGLNYGFIGGSTGLLDKNTWAVTGSIEKLKSAHKIYDYLAAKAIEIVTLSDGQIIDIGSVIPLLTE